MSVFFKIGESGGRLCVFLDGYIALLHSSIVVHGSVRDLVVSVRTHGGWSIRILTLYRIVTIELFGWSSLPQARVLGL